MSELPDSLMQYMDVKIKNFSTNVDADLAKNILEGKGIRSVVQHLGSMPQGQVGPISIFVLEKDAQMASEILKDFRDSNTNIKEKPFWVRVMDFLFLKLIILMILAGIVILGLLYLLNFWGIFR